jgi:hypothetical protein
MPRSARLRRSVGLAAGHCGCGRTCPREGIGAAQCVGQPVPAGHAPDQVRASAAGIPAAVTNSERPEDPRTTGTAWVAVRNLDLATPITGMPNSAYARAPRPGRPAVEISVTIDHQQAHHPAQIIQDRAQRRQLAQVELARPVGRYPGDHRGAFGQHVREGGIGGQDGCRPGAAGPEVMHLHGSAHAAVRAPAGLHVLRMPEPAPGIRTVLWQLPARVRSNRSSRSRSVIGLRRARARVTDLVDRVLWPGGGGRRSGLDVLYANAADPTPAGPGERSGGAAAGEADNSGDLLN